jgi:hypothetical protein
MTKQIVEPGDFPDDGDSIPAASRAHSDIAPGLLRAPRTIQQVNQLTEDWQEALYRVLVPSQLLVQFGIHPIRLADHDGARLVTFERHPESPAVQLSVRHRLDAEDPVYLLQLEDSALGSVVVAFMVTNDPLSQRYDIDRDEEGRRTLLGTARRNLAEEEKAMLAGLAPGQVRNGLRLMDQVMARVEAFLVTLGKDTVLVEPLAYHNAILFERHGFAYTQGQAEMEWIHAAFQSGGELWAAMDDSTPFRRQAAAQTIRGRSWAIHDGILGRLWKGVKMIKRLVPPVRVDTAPGVPW